MCRCHGPAHQPAWLAASHRAAAQGRAGTPVRLTALQAGRHLVRWAVAAQAEADEAELWSAVATLEETAALARHLSGHTGLGGGAAGQQARSADRAARLAESLRAQIQDTAGR